MRAKKYINKYLENNYDLFADRTFLYRSKETNNVLTESKISQDLILVFGNFIGLGIIFNEWANHHKNRITNGLIKYFKSMDLSLGSYELSNKISLCIYNGFDIIKNNNREFIFDEFENFYIMEKYNDSKIFAFVNSEKFNLEYHNSTNLITLMLDCGVKETQNVIEKVKIKLNEWYYENFFKYKLNKLLEELELTLDNNSWAFKHPIYGTFYSENKIFEKIFSGESEYQKYMFLKVFEEWLEKNMYNVSEKEMNKLYNL